MVRRAALPSGHFTAFTVHPVLGIIMAVVADRDLDTGEEVTVPRHQQEIIYNQPYIGEMP